MSPVQHIGEDSQKMEMFVCLNILWQFKKIVLVLI